MTSTSAGSGLDRLDPTGRAADPLGHTDSAALLARQTGILELIAAGAPLVEVLTGIALTLEDLVPDCRCSVLLFDAEAGTLSHGAAPSLPAAYSSGIDGMAIGSDAGSCGSAVYLGVVVVAEDIATDPRWPRYRDLADRHALRACWSTPILGRTGVVGTFAVYHDRTHRPSAREQRLAERLSHLASIAIDHDQLFGALTESEERFRRAFEDNAVGMALAEPDGTVTRVNRALCTLLGRSEDDLLGTSLDALFPHPDGDRPAQYESRTADGHGRRLDLAVAVSPVLGAHGTPVHLCVNVLDLTQRRAAERERRRRHEAEVARTAAEAASRAKSDFVAALGHELRTPLQAVTGFTELLRTLDLPAERRAAALTHIESASAHILSMVDDVLDVARIEAGGLPLRPSAVPLDAVVTDVLALLEPLAAAERVTLFDHHVSDEHPAGSPAWVFADPRRCRQVLLNVVTNAIRYNRPGGSVHVTTAGPGPDGPDEVVVTVRDTGPGIAAADLDRLFAPFDRLGAHDDQGVGLGLPLARGLIEAMGGRLTVHSTVGTGTTVTVCLPASGPD